MAKLFAYTHVSLQNDLHSVTGVTPNEAVLGRQVLTPATLIAQPPNETHKPTVPYVTSFRNIMPEAHTHTHTHTHVSDSQQHL